MEYKINKHMVTTINDAVGDTILYITRVRECGGIPKTIMVNMGSNTLLMAFQKKIDTITNWDDDIFNMIWESQRANKDDYIE